MFGLPVMGIDVLYPSNVHICFPKEEKITNSLAIVHHKLMVNIVLKYKYVVLALNFKFAMDDEGDGRCKLHRIFSPSLDSSKVWYALPNELMSDGRRKSIVHGEVSRFFSGEILEISIGEVNVQDGSKASYSLFGRQKKDQVVVASTFGLLVINLRTKFLHDNIFF